jgi:hypothetical protein
MSGPDNYNHQKIGKLPGPERFLLPGVYALLTSGYNGPINSHISLTKLTEFRTITDENAGQNTCRQNCTPACTIKEVIQEWEMGIVAGSPWNFQRLLALKRVSRRDADVYASGTDGSASLCSFQGKWWVVFGVRKVGKRKDFNQPDERKTHLYLHSILRKDWPGPDLNAVQAHLNAVLDKMLELAPICLDWEKAEEKRRERERHNEY